MDTYRDSILEMMGPLIADLANKAEHGRFRDKETHRIRVSYYNALARMISSYNQVLKDAELQQLQEEVEELKELIKQSRED